MMAKPEYGSYKKPAEGGSMEYGERPEIEEPERRAKERPERYASIEGVKKKEELVTEPSLGKTEGGWEAAPSIGKPGGREKGRDKLPRYGYLRDSVFIFDEKNLDYNKAWENRFNKRVYHWFFANTSRSENGTVCSSPFYCAPYRWALMLINVTGSDAAALKIEIKVEFSWDGVSFFHFMQDWWGMDMITGAMAAATYRQSMPIPILAPWIRVCYVVSGVDQTTWSNITITGIFNSV
ncbi:hypothetical protein AYK26_07035 [Euryarchaeota archaeon SM23-78]|nr:MAG: hypothetical protein AYK26_07035 [Euryarchaeota archaeon SM23-78]